MVPSSDGYQRPSTTRSFYHSDHGAHDTALILGERCRAAGTRRSMGAVGGCVDTVLAKSFFATLECDLRAHHTVRTHAEARTTLFSSIAGFYNRRRRHVALGYLSPEAYDRSDTHQQAVA